MMKNLIRINIGLLIAFTLFGCQNWFDIENKNTIEEREFWQNEQEAFMGLMAAYGGLQNHGSMGGNSAAQMPTRSDIGRPSIWNDQYVELSKLLINDNTGIVKLKWADLYTTIFRTNQVLDRVPEIVEISEESRALFLAEAHFIRGICYYWLYSTYNNGSIILHTTVAQSKEEIAKPLSPKEDVLALILSDLTYAQERLPENWEEKYKGRATWGAATAFLGQVYINEHEYLKAQNEFKKIIDREDLYQLTPDISWNFDIEHEFNSESIFEVSFSDTQKPNGGGVIIDGPSGTEGTRRGVFLAPSGANGNRLSMPSYWITMLYQNDEMDPTDSRNEGLTHSLRSQNSIVMADDDFDYYQKHPRDVHGTFKNKESSYLRKYQNWWDEYEAIGNKTISGINERVIRLADVYLLYAECLIKNNGSAGTFEAVHYINRIRTRSAVLPLDHNEYNTAEKLMDHIMFVERPLELMFEGHDTRWVDMRRWGVIKEQYERLAKKKYYMSKQILYELPEDATEGPKGEDVLQEFQDAAASYTPDYHNYFPIPIDEELSNPNL
ncbi:RagB/SusD family nutrient uptake outer membrane protein [Flammeovirga sp. OC4]|uniref:RagB/SusD family nutrient uptake outer membrane protein n=1 Tax=Flammeovirga sp. OC4 TaxID=1382345 RepID=UPI0009E3F3F2|nr:RagB/SusD family nutrient uptake outer membrane protein [Flammeovirga sp. OC4]